VDPEPIRPEPIRTVLADDHALVRSGVRSELGGQFQVVGEADDADGAIDVIQARKPALVVCDLHMPGGGGLAVVQACATICPIVILTVSEAERDLLDAAPRARRLPVEVGASRRAPFSLRGCGFGRTRLLSVAGRTGPRRISEAGQVFGQQSVVRPRTTSPATGGARLRYGEIAAELSISPKTVENHVRNILGKLHLTRRTDLVRYAVQHGLD
jgi:CheY-like chemotaxis protein